MLPSEVYRLIKPVDIGPVLAVWDRLNFIHVNQGSTNKVPASVVLPAHFPSEINAFVEGLGLGGTLGRALIRRLGSRQGIPPHVDSWMPKEANWRRFQIPLVSHPEIKMRWPDDGVEAHLAPGFLYEVRFDRLHEVVNPTDVERSHLQVDQIDATI